MKILIRIPLSTGTCLGNRTLSGPVFILEPKSRVEFLNTDGARLDCSAHGDPDPKIEWFRLDKNHLQVKVEDVKDLVKVDRNGSVVLQSFPAEDYRQELHATVYTCSATNTHGRIVSSPVSVRAGEAQPLSSLTFILFSRCNFK